MRYLSEGTPSLRDVAKVTASQSWQSSRPVAAEGSPLSGLTSPRLEVRLAKLAVASGRSVSTLAAVTRAPVLRARVAQTVAVDVT